MPQKATVFIMGEDLTFIQDKEGVKNVFAGDKGELVIVYENQIVKYHNCPFTVENGRKAIEA